MSVVGTQSVPAASCCVTGQQPMRTEERERDHLPEQDAAPRTSRVLPASRYCAKFEGFYLLYQKMSTLKFKGYLGSYSYFRQMSS